MNNMSVGTQMGRSAIQFFIATGNQIQQAEQQLKQQQDQFESQKAHLEEQAKEEKKMGIWDATLSTARTGGSIGKGYAGIPGYIAGAVAGAVIGGTVSTVTTYAPEIYDWTTTKAKKAAEKCTIQ